MSVGVQGYPQTGKWRMVRGSPAPFDAGHNGQEGMMSETWVKDGLTFTELIRQEYGENHCVFSAGTVEGHPVDTLYLRWGKDDDDGGMLLLRPDELQAIAWVATGAVWSDLMGRLDDVDTN